MQEDIAYRPTQQSFVYEVEDLIREALKREIRWDTAKNVVLVGQRFAEKADEDHARRARISPLSWTKNQILVIEARQAFIHMQFLARSFGEKVAGYRERF